MQLLWNTFLLLAIQIVHFSKGECIIEGIDLNAPSFTNAKVNDTERVKFGIFATKGVSSVEPVGTPDVKYFKTVVTSNGTLIVGPSKEFENYEENEPKTSYAKITAYLSITCTDGDVTVIQFIQPIIDINNHSPYFTKTKYILNIPTFLKKDTDINKLLSQPITLCDIDITNYRLFFEFTMTTSVPVSNRQSYYQSTKCVIAELKLTKDFNFTTYTTFNLIVQDSNYPTRSNISALILVPKTQPEEDPKFEYPVYNGTYVCDKSSHNVTFNQRIQIQNRFKIKEASLSGSNGVQYFRIAVPTSNSVEISIKDRIPEEVLNSSSTINLDLVAEVEGSEQHATAKVVVSLPKNCSSVNPTPADPSFEHPIYNATYECFNCKHQIVFRNRIQVQENFTIVNVTLHGRHSVNFQVSLQNNSVEIGLIHNLDSEILKNKTLLQYRLEAVIKDFNRNISTQIVIVLPTHECQASSSTPKIIRGKYLIQEFVDRNLGFTLVINEIVLKNKSQEVIVAVPHREEPHVYGLLDLPWGILNVEITNRPDNVTEIRFLYFPLGWSRSQLLLR